jgi:hypothetical protein
MKTMSVYDTIRLIMKPSFDERTRFIPPSDIEASLGISYSPEALLLLEDTFPSIYDIFLKKEMHKEGILLPGPPKRINFMEIPMIKNFKPKSNDLRILENIFIETKWLYFCPSFFDLTWREQKRLSSLREDYYLLNITELCWVLNVIRDVIGAKNTSSYRTPTMNSEDDHMFARIENRKVYLCGDDDYKYCGAAIGIKFQEMTFENLKKLENQ